MKEDKIKLDKATHDFIYEKTINLKEYLDENDFDVIKLLHIKLKSSMCSEFEFKLLMYDLFEYYDFEKLKKSNELSEHQKYLLEQFEANIEFEKQLYSEGIIKEVYKRKSFRGTGVNEQRYEETLSKIEYINYCIKIDKVIDRAIRKSVERSERISKSKLKNE